jgi:hypothetical protein
MSPSDVISLFGIVFLFGLPVAAWVISRVLAHNEYMAMIRAGMVPPPDPKMMRRAMRQGWMPPPGAAPSWDAAAWPGTAQPGAYGNYYAQRQLSRGITVAFVGMALVIGLSFIHGGDGTHFGPWLLGGLIPLFVGVAQIITAMLGGARIGIPATTPLGGGTAQPGGYQQPTSGTGPFGPPPPSTGPYGWRPGSIPEIEKPTSPPETR